MGYRACKSPAAAASWPAFCSSALTSFVCANPPPTTLTHLPDEQAPSHFSFPFKLVSCSLIYCFLSPPPKRVARTCPHVNL